MGLYNFKSRFEPFILDGRKQHTIRGERKYPDAPGDTMHLYTGLRTKKAKLLLRVPCVRVERIEIWETFVYNGKLEKQPGSRRVHVGVAAAKLTQTEKESLACADGFASFAEMMEFWDGRLPFTGHIYHWRFTARSR